MSNYRSSVKRTLDVLVAAGALVLLSPVMLAVAALVALRLGRPVLFRQVRPGLHGKPFTILKFRTMLDTYDSDGQPLPDAERLTQFGRFLRSTSLDELPELINVLRGDMSLVGPRPLITAYLDRYTPQQARRHEVRPGITGWAQVNGRNTLDWNDRFALDVHYVDNHSLLLDLKILWLTLRTVVQREGIHAEGHETMPEFTGTPAKSGSATQTRPDELAGHALCHGRRRAADGPEPAGHQ
jgi:lipopolysaccharide/colanic/teichoic acid biosynthesis glycosyltransferase